MTCSTPPASPSPRSSRPSGQRAPPRATTSANRRQRPIWNAAQAGAARPAGVRRPLRQRHRGADLAGLAGTPLSGHLTGERRQSQWRGAGSAPRLPPAFCRPRSAGRLPRAPAPHVGGPDLQGRSRAPRHAAREWTHHAAAVLQRFEAGYIAFYRPEFLELSRPTTCRPSCARVTRCSSIRRCTTAPAKIRPAIFAGWPTCCRSRPSGGRWNPGPHRDGPRGVSRAAGDEVRRPGIATSTTPSSPPPRATPSHQSRPRSADRVAGPRPARSTWCWPPSNPITPDRTRCRTERPGRTENPMTTSD